MLSFVGFFAFAPTSAADFPPGTVTANVTSVSDCSNILSTGSITGASAAYSGGNLAISLPAGGPLALGSTLTILGIPVGPSASGVSAQLSGDESLTGTATAGIELDGEGVPTAFAVTTGVLIGDCTASFTASGFIPASSNGSAHPSNQNEPSTTVVQGDTALARTTTGVFADASNAAGLATRALAGAAGRALTFNRNGAGFSTRGLPAGEWTLPIGVWGNLGYTWSDNEFVSTAADSDRWHGTIGIDASVTDWLIAGIAGGYENDDIDTRFNAGNIETEGFTLVTYLGALLSDRLSIDLALGRSFLDSDQLRTAGGTRVTSSVDGERIFAAGNASYGGTYGQWRLTARAGLLWLRDEQDAFTESDGAQVAKSIFKVGRAKLGGEVARTLGAFEPYVSATYHYSFHQTRAVFAAGVPTPGIDRADMLLGVGARYFGSERLSGSLEFSTLLGRDHVDEHSVNLLLRADF